MRRTARSSPEIPSLQTRDCTGIARSIEGSSRRAGPAGKSTRTATGEADTMDAISGSSDLGQQQFLELLVTQLKNQDPLEPVEQTEFISQLAQFSVVEGVETLNLQFDDMLRLQQLTEGAQLVGRTVEFISPITGETVQAPVQEARVLDGRMMLTAGTDVVPLDQVLAVVDSTEASG
nr:flagellar hook capping FlgD N-terminal domain-containing protein [Maioricimonas rarisocia]